MINYDLFLEDGDLLEMVEASMIINEAIFLPSKIKELKTKIKDQLKRGSKNYSLKERFKTSIKKEIPGEQKLIINTLKKFKVDVINLRSYITYTNGAESSSNHNVLATYENYVLYFSFSGAYGNVFLTNISVRYDDSECTIPSKVVFDCVSMLPYNIDDVKSNKNSVKITPKSSSYVDSLYNKMTKKYGEEYDVKKNFGGFSITISSKK